MAIDRRGQLEDRLQAEESGTKTAACQKRRRETASARSRKRGPRRSATITTSTRTLQKKLAKWRP